MKVSYLNCLECVLKLNILQAGEKVDSWVRDDILGQSEADRIMKTLRVFLEANS